jgi:hypothetical protein
MEVMIAPAARKSRRRVLTPSFYAMAREAFYQTFEREMFACAKIRVNAMSFPNVATFNNYLHFKFPSAVKRARELAEQLKENEKQQSLEPGRQV